MENLPAILTGLERLVSADQMGSLQGNRQLQRMMVSLRQDSPGGADALAQVMRAPNDQNGGSPGAAPVATPETSTEQEG